jgi:linoleoyl-CoA desaturase
MIKPKFSVQGSQFHQVLKTRINEYFSQNNIQPTGNWHLYLKAIILLMAFIGTYIHMVFFYQNGIVGAAEAILLGLLAASIGFNVMHDGAHGSFSQRRWINKMAGLSLNFLGANVTLWSTKHNIIHHTYTNVDEIDDDIDAKPFLRLCSNQKRYFFHRFQHFYFPILYSLLYIFWIFYTDFNKYFKGKIGEVEFAPFKLGEHISFWVSKIVFVFLFLVTPIYLLGFTTWLTGFMIYIATTGIVISMVFQLAHTVENAQFPLANNNKLEDDWAAHQIKTTANFATDNRIVSWFLGGLNFQIEHHLFPKISHVHYPAISKIIKKTVQEFEMNYMEFPKVRHAVVSHYNYLKSLGK